MNHELRTRTFGYISASLGLVAGLAWNDAITELIKTFFPIAQNTIFIKFVYAAIVTVVVVILIGYIDKLSKKEEK